MPEDFSKSASVVLTTYCDDRRLELALEGYAAQTC
jgi:hypothetical protein